jgi:ribonuclease BN (tRNA processing enzyme)
LHPDPSISQWDREIGLPFIRSRAVRVVRLAETVVLFSGDRRVKVTIIPSSVTPPGQDQEQYLISYLINDSVAVDAGCLGFYLTPVAQAKVQHVLISHTHADHIASLPIFVENAYEAGDACVTVHGSRAVLDCLRTDVFNGRVWPDFLGMAEGGPSFLRLGCLEHLRPIEVEGLRITPVEVDHVVPTMGFLIEDDHSALIIASDTGPTEALWRLASATPALKAVFLEASFPDELDWLAALSMHMTPARLAIEVRKVTRPTRWIAVHMKARYREQIRRELADLHLDGLEIGQFGTPYSF